MTKPADLPIFFDCFLEQFAQMRSPPLADTAPASRGRPPLLATEDIIAGLAWHVLQPCGTLAQNLSMLGTDSLCDAALSERRQSLGAQPWLDALEGFLGPVADPHRHPHAFYRGLRLVGVDGTTFNVANTPAMKLSAKKSKARRGSAAFHRVGCVALVELGTHCTLALRVAQNDESEGALSAQIVDALGSDDLLIADRYYGSGKWAARILRLPQHPHFLLRVQDRFGALTERRLGDGSRLVRVKDPDSGEFIMLREIKAKVRRPGKRWVKVRFWTNLLDHRRYPAQELLALYAMRWEHEIAYREIKQYIHDDNLLLSHTPVTAIQEICALFMAQAIVTRVRTKTADVHSVSVMQISFEKTLNACRNLCWLVSVTGDCLSTAQLQKISQAVERQLIAQASKQRRKRSCPRKVRQPINKWPRLMKTQYDKGDFEYEIRKS
jgi:hypothetical protein